MQEFDQDDLTKVKNITKMLSDLGVYHETFEAPFLERTGEFFGAKSMEKFDDHMPLPEYLLFAEGLIQIEGKFAHFYLQHGTFLKVVELLETKLIADHKVKILSGLPNLLDTPQEWHKNEGALRTLYEFFD